MHSCPRDWRLEASWGTDCALPLNPSDLTALWYGGVLGFLHYAERHYFQSFIHPVSSVGHVLTNIALQFFYAGAFLCLKNKPQLHLVKFIWLFFSLFSLTAHHSIGENIITIPYCTVFIFILLHLNVLCKTRSFAVLETCSLIRFTVTCDHHHYDFFNFSAIILFD